MATTEEFIMFLCEQLQSLKTITAKKMFGEYMVYYLDKPVLLICDETIYIKINDTTTNILGENCKQGFPYAGAKIHYIFEDVEDSEKLCKLIVAIEKITPLPKKRKKS